MSYSLYNIIFIAAFNYQEGRSTHFREINISAKTAELIISFSKSLNMCSEGGN